MSSFLQKLKGKGVVEDKDAVVGQPAQSVSHSSSPQGVTQLAVDVYQSDREIVIFAQISGADINDLDVSIEGDNDIITIQGNAHRPDALGLGADTGHDDKAGFSLEECQWGKFYRQIILPEEVDAERAEAKAKDGVLILRLPLKGQASNKFRMQISKIAES
jgi:HSP20 family molecular chaperone IbpA